MRRRRRAMARQCLMTMMGGGITIVNERRRARLCALSARLQVALLAPFFICSSFVINLCRFFGG